MANGLLPKRTEQEHEALEMAKPLTPKSERPRSTWGSLSMSLQNLPNVCPLGKCFKKKHHTGDCYPT